ncbi:MAG TPA: hypothetical protein VIT62_09405 [Lysobacter sp.]
MAIEHARDIAKPSQYRDLVATAYRVPNRSRQPLLPTFTHDLGQVLTYEPFKPLDLRREFEWALQILERHAPKIGAFLERKQRVQAEVVLGNDEQALILIEEIGREFGISCWVIQAKIALLQACHGQEAQKTYAHDVFSRAKGVLKAVAHLTSQRNEDAVSTAGFKHRAVDSIDGWDIPSAWSAYLRYKLIGEVPVAEAQILEVLVTASGGSCIDLLEACLDILVWNYEFLVDRKVQAIGRLEALVGKTWSGGGTDLQRILESARCGSTTDRSRLIDRATGQFSTVLLRGADADSFGQLEKTCLNFGFLPVFSAIDIVARAITAKEILNYESVLNRLGTGIGLEGGLWPTSSVFAASEHLLQAVDTAYRNGDENALQVACEQLGEGDSFDKVTCAKSRFLWADHSGNWQSAIATAVECLIEFPGARNEFGLFDVLRSKSWQELKGVSDPTILALALSYAGNELLPGQEAQKLNRNLQQIALRVLRAAGCKHFSELMSEAEESLSLRRFLSDVCSQQVMEVNVHLSSSKELSLERMKICQGLVKLDPDRSAKYLEEIRQITFSIELEDGIRSFDSSRLFVNEAGLQDWAEKALAEDYSRYRSLRGNSLPDLADIQSAVLALHSDRDAPVPHALLEQPKTEADRLLIDLAQRLLREFLHGTEFGLNSYLSLRVRHGSLAGHLRGPLEEAGSISLRDASISGYQPITRWHQLLSEMPIEKAVAINQAFADFSAEFDRGVEFIVEELLQIKSEVKEAGAFDLTFTPFLMNLLKGALAETIETRDFAKTCIAYFKASLEPCLSRVRSHISGEFKEAADREMDDLLARLDMASDGAELSPVLDAVKRGRTNLSFAVHRVTDWFQSVDRGDHERRYSLEQIIRIGERLTINTRPSFQPELAITLVGDIPEFTPQLGAFLIADALFIVLDNAHLYSGIEGPLAITVNVELRDGGLLAFEVVNSAAPGASSQEARERLEQIRQKLTSGEYKRMASGEGGTGLFKLRRLTDAHTEGSEESLEFDFVEDGFKVTFVIPITSTTILEEEDCEDPDR